MYNSTNIKTQSLLKLLEKICFTTYSSGNNLAYFIITYVNKVEVLSSLLKLVTLS